MIKVKLTTNFPNWPLIRQSPKSSGVWGNFQFHINDNIKECDWWIVYNGLPAEKQTVFCDPRNTIFITGEPSSIKKYSKKFLDQFNYIITSHSNIQHRNKISTQQSLPWMVGGKFTEKSKTWDKNFTKDYDELTTMLPFKKSKTISVISSNKNQTDGHRQRLKFVLLLKDTLGDKFDLYGVGNGTIADKWDGLAPYKYSVVIENSVESDYWTEKLSDAFLAQTFPIYFGCPNIYDYFPHNSLAVIDITKPEKAIAQIKKIIADNSYEKSLPYILEAKDMVLNKYNLFPALIDVISKLPQHNKKSEVVFSSKTRAVSVFRRLTKEHYNLIYKMIKHIYKKIKGGIVTQFLKLNKRHKEVLKWREIDGDNTLRLNYPLSSTSVVFDIGGYKGKWAQSIYDKYHCHIYIFEPIKNFAEQIINRFQNNPKISIYTFGLSGSTKDVEISLSQDSSSTQKNGELNEVIKLIKISDFIKNNNIKHIDLIKINIEGDEYDLLEDLIENKLTTNMENIQVQFHNFVPNAKTRMKHIQKELEKTHHRTYHYEFVWENWEKLK